MFDAISRLFAPQPANEFRPAPQLAVAALLALRGSRRWPDPSSRYDREQAAPSGRRGEVVSSDWEDLSAGVDPTDVPAEDRT